MLQACRVLSPVRGSVSARHLFVHRVCMLNLISSNSFSTTFTVLQKADTKEPLINSKTDKKLEEDAGFQELKERVLKMRAAQLDLLQKRGLLDTEGNSVDSLPSATKKPYTCGSCGKSYKTANGLAQHTKHGSKCSAKSIPGVVETRATQDEELVQKNLAEHKCGGCGRVYKH